LEDDIDMINYNSNERIGYPTQKPEALLQRIFECSTNEGDIVLDPFVGGGTTIAVAEKLHRRWVGIDQSVQAVKVTEMRLQNQMDLFLNPFVIQLHKYDYDTLRYKDAFAFDSWIITQFGGQPQNKKGEQTHKFKPGLHNIAVKVIDNDGLENIEIIKLRINGKAERE